MKGVNYGNRFNPEDWMTGDNNEDDENEKMCSRDLRFQDARQEILRLELHVLHKPFCLVILLLRIRVIRVYVIKSTLLYRVLSSSVLFVLAHLLTKLVCYGTCS